MKNSTVVLLAAAAILLSPALSRSQGGSTAVPFLLIPPAPEGLGIGGGSASLPTTDAIATVVNPGQLGLFSLTNLFNASTYAPRSSSFLQYKLPDMSYGVTALNAGYNFRSLLSLPFDFSAGFGYSRVSLDLGTFSVTNAGDPTVIGKFEAKEYSENLSVGVGLDYYIQIGLGFNFKRIVSELSPIGTEQGAATGKSSATDFGLLVNVPVLGIASNLSGASLEIAPQITPFLDLSSGYVKANVGPEMTYGDPAQADPLPRTAVLGLSIGTGLTMKTGKTDWQLASFRLVHQADDLLVTRNSDGTFNYQSGLGDIQFWNDVVLGKCNPLVTSRRGWQLQVGEFFSWREGSVATPGYSPATTSGYSICLGGLLKFINAISQSPDADGSWLAFAKEHFDLQFHSAKYTPASSAEGSTTAQSLNLVVKGFSF